ncbi:hypothetical protein F3Y22_tig00110809pilonHSYRG00235 [Hibiscus syriacus]|uniref:Uncharacterized protein n=1 Tax=Hibiscus syriacus TaxID=106335 RepID=A0A6A2ZNH3_HIBSY|nr:hypothetical protein F3Y22_tig00110809pilonHSYRG00235 [Hibiscus syriacus]
MVAMMIMEQVIATNDITYVPILGSGEDLVLDSGVCRDIHGDSNERLRLTPKEYPFAFMLACVGYLLTMVADCVVSYVYGKGNSSCHKVIQSFKAFPLESLRLNSMHGKPYGQSHCIRYCSHCNGDSTAPNDPDPIGIIIDATMEGAMAD